MDNGFKEQTRFEWFTVEESKMGFNFGSLSNKLFTEVGIYAELGVYSGTIYKYNVMFNISSFVDDKKQSISLNGSNSVMLSTVFELYSEDSSIKEYFNRTKASNGWYVSNKYTNKAVFQKVLNDKLSIKFIPIVDNRCIPLYKVMFVKSDYTLSIVLSKAEMRTLSKLLINFASNIPLYVYMFQTGNKYNKLDRFIDKIDKIAYMLEQYNNSNVNSCMDNTFYSNMDWNPDSLIDVDNTSVEEDINNVDLVNHEPKVTEEKTDVIDINSLGKELDVIIDHSDTNNAIQEKSGIMVSDRAGYNVVDEFSLYPSKEEDAVIEPVMERSYIDEQALEDSRKVYTSNSTDVVLNTFAKTYKVDRRKKFKSIIRAIEKAGVFSPESIPVILVNRGMIGLPCTSLLYSISVFAATYDYSNKYPDKDFTQLAIAAHNSLEMSAVDGHEMFSNDDEFKSLGNKYLECLIKTIGNSAKDIRTIDKYFVLEDNLYNFCVLKDEYFKNLTPDEANCLTAAVTDVYMLLHYANTRYLSNRVMQEKNAELVSVVNEQMYTLARNILVELIQFTDKTVYAEHVVRFEDTVKFFSWDTEIYKEACIELFTYALYYKNNIFEKTDIPNTIKVGLPCLKS